MKALFFGQSKSGKTTACHALSYSSFCITKPKSLYNTVSQLGDNNRKIGNTGDSQTEFVSQYDLDNGNYILDTPSIDDTRGEDYNVWHLIRIEDELKKNQKLRIAICVEESCITEANGSQLINITNNFINLLSLSIEDLNAILIIVTKSKPGFHREVRERYNEMCPNKSNFIIEGIKNGSVNLVDFEYPVANGSSFEFRKENLQEITVKLSKLGSISTSVLLKNILPHIMIRMNRIVRSDLTTKFTFTSKLQKNIPRIEADSILCIDSDLTIQSNKLTINAQNIIVLSDLSAKEKRYIKLQGEDPTIEFSEVKSVRNASNLIVSVINTIEFDFTYPKNKEFNKNTEFFLIERIFVNGPWTKYATFNNKALVLIAYIKPQNGTIHNIPDKSINILSADIRLKLCIIEELESKENMKKKLKSLKDFNSVDAYLNECGKFDLAQEIKVCLEEFAFNIPSIFQLLVGQTIKRFGSKVKEVSELFSIRRMLIIRYLDVVSEMFSKRNNNEEISRALERINSFLGKSSARLEDLATEKPKVIENLSNHINNLKKEDQIKDFFSVFHAVIESGEKNHSLALAMADQKPNYIGTIIKLLLVGACSLVGYKILSQKCSYTETSSVCLVSAGLMLTFIAQKVICSINSGYFEGEYKLEPKQQFELSSKSKVN